MLRRSFSTVLSSVSTRSLLSIRQFCAPATSADDQITTVRTTGVQWEKDGIKKTYIGIYWGNGDERNKAEFDASFDSIDFREMRFRAIAMALRAAEKNGLKRIRLQTDYKLTHPRLGVAEQIKMVKLGIMREHNGATSMTATCDEILKYVEAIEVIWEHRSCLAAGSKRNEVMRLLDEDRRRMSFKILPIEAFDHIITPKDALPLEGRTVPTVYAVGRSTLHEGRPVGALAYLWVPESIDHLPTKPRSSGSILRAPPIVLHQSLLRARMLAIKEAIHEAQILNIPEIQVITDSRAFVYYYKMGWRQKNGSPAMNEKLYLKIKELTETRKVHFKAARLTDDREWMTKAYEMAKGQEKETQSPLAFY